MLNDLKRFSKLKNEWKKHWKTEIVDIFVFGSFVKGKSQPNDIDLCLVFREKVNLELIKKANLILGDNFHLSSLTVDNFFTQSHSLVKTMLLEGKSLITNQSWSTTFGLKSSLLYSYTISELKSNLKVRFVNLLRGKNGKSGLVKQWLGEFISNSSFLVPIEKDNEVREVLGLWKVRYQRRKILLMS